MKTDIQSLDDIQSFVDLFYQRIQNHERLGPIFANVAQVDWTKHLQTMYQFWDTVIFGSTAYQGNPLTAHLAVNQKLQAGDASEAGLQPEDFSAWLTLFESTLDELFAGVNASFAKQSAKRMAQHLSKVCAKGYKPSGLNRVPYRTTPPSAEGSSRGSDPGNGK